MRQEIACARHREASASFQRRQALPVKARSGIGLAPWCNVRVPDDRGDRVLCAQGREQIDEATILRLGEGQFVAALEFDTQREIVAALTAVPA